MGWYGIYNLKYKGDDKEKFVKVAKLVIPAFNERFDVKNNALHCKRLLSWYTSEMDISEILSFLNEGDTVELTIDGETHPWVKRGVAEKANLSYYEEVEEDDSLEGGASKKKSKNDPVELEFEKVTFTNKNGEVYIENEFEDEDRYIYDTLGNFDVLQYDLEHNDMQDLEGQLSDWANVVVGDKEMAEIACKHFENIFGDLEQEDIEKCDLMANLQKAISSPEKLEEFLSGYKKEKEENKPQSDWFDVETELDDMD